MTDTLTPVPRTGDSEVKRRHSCFLIVADRAPPTPPDGLCVCVSSLTYAGTPARLFTDETIVGVHLLRIIRKQLTRTFTSWTDR